MRLRRKRPTRGSERLTRDPSCAVSCYGLHSTTNSVPWRSSMVSSFGHVRPRTRTSSSSISAAQLASVCPAPAEYPMIRQCHTPRASSIARSRASSTASTAASLTSPVGAQAEMMASSLASPPIPARFGTGSRSTRSESSSCRESRPHAAAGPCAAQSALSRAACSRTVSVARSDLSGG